jgi:hypothetical protein
MSMRKHDRVNVQGRVEYRTAWGRGEGMSMDLTLQGCRIKGAHSFSCGIRVRLQLWFPDQAQPVNIEQAVVRWVKDDQFGVSFQVVPPDVRARLKHQLQLLHEAQAHKVIA